MFKYFPQNVDNIGWVIESAFDL